jgi:membrane protein
VNPDAAEPKLTPVRSALQIARRALEELRKDDLAGLAAQMSYYFTLALFPLLILLIGILDLLPLEQEVPRLMDRLVAGFPGDIQNLLRRFLSEFAERRPSSGVFLWLLVALWAGSKAISGARGGLNRVMRDVRLRNPFLTRLTDIGFTAAAVVFVGAGYVLIFGGKALGVFLAKLLGLSELFPLVWAWLRWPSTLVLLTVFLTLAYRLLPDRRVTWRAALAGALPTCLGWTALLGSFRIWLHFTARFDQLYGSLASFFILMLVLWMFGLVFLLGGEVVAWRTTLHEAKKNAAPA